MRRTTLTTIIFLLVIATATATNIQFEDTFDRNNNNSLGADWTETESNAGDLSIVSNQLQVSRSSADVQAYTTITNHEIINFTFWHTGAAINTRIGFTNRTAGSPNEIIGFYDEWDNTECNYLEYIDGGWTEANLFDGCGAGTQWIISLVFNTTANNVSYFFNGSYKGSIAGFNDSFSSTVNAISIGGHDKNGVNAYVDHVVVSNTSEPPPPPPVSVLWSAYAQPTPKITNITTLDYGFNISAGTGSICYLRTSTTIYGNATDVAEDTETNITGTFSAGNHSLFVSCLNDSVYYNSSIKILYVDTTAPVISCTYPLCDNTTIIENGTYVAFEFNITDDQAIYSWNLTCTSPAGIKLIDANLIGGLDNVTFYDATTSPHFLNVSGTYSCIIESYDQHNAPAQPYEHIAEWELEEVTYGTKIKTDNQDLTITTNSTLVESLEWKYEPYKWKLKLKFTHKILSGTDIYITVHSTKTLDPLPYSKYQGHIIALPYYIDFETDDATAQIASCTEQTCTVKITLTKDANSIQFKTLGPMNLARIYYTFKSNSAPKLDFINNITITEGGAWTYDANATDAENDTLTWTINETKYMGVAAATGILNGTGHHTYNGQYVINISVTDNNLYTSQIFFYFIALQWRNTTSIIEMSHCLLYGNWTNGTSCSIGNVMTEDDSMIIGVSIIGAILIGFFLTMSLVLDKNNVWMRVVKLFLLMVSFYMTLPLIQLGLGAAKSAGAATYITDSLEIMYTVDVWVIRIFTAIIMLYITYEALMALGWVKKKRFESII